MNPLPCQVPCQSNIGIPDSFKALITPAINLMSITTGDPYIEFRIRKKNHTVTLQWEPFQCTVAQNGIASLSVQQTIGQMPMYPMRFNIQISLRGTWITTALIIDPNVSSQIQFLLDISGQGFGINAGDAIIVPASSVTWITNY